jgi:hypothetical protein
VVEVSPGGSVARARLSVFEVAAGSSTLPRLTTLYGRGGHLRTDPRLHYPDRLPSASTDADCDVGYGKELPS